MSLKDQLDKFFHNNDYSNNLRDTDLIVVRPDGLISFRQSFIDTESATYEALGVLAVGSWQASKEMMNSVELGGNDRFRFDFSTSSSGVYAVPMYVGGKELLIVNIYNNYKNPGYLKNQIRNLAKKLEEILTVEVDFLASEREGFLFENVTDEEIDKLFSF